MGSRIMAFFYPRALLTPHGAFKILELVLVLVCFLLARLAFEGKTGLIFGPTLDHAWLGCLTLRGWLIILPSIIIGLLLGDPICWIMDCLLSLIGSCLYLATGACTIIHHNRSNNISSIKDTGLSLGSLCVITGIVMFVDALVLGILYGRKKKSLQI